MSAPLPSPRSSQMSSLSSLHRLCYLHGPYKQSLFFFNLCTYCSVTLFFRLKTSQGHPAMQIHTDIAYPFFKKKVCMYFGLSWVFLLCLGFSLASLSVAVCGLLIVVASLVVPRLKSTGSAVMKHGLSCSMARGIFLDQGSNPYPLHW